MANRFDEIFVKDEKEEEEEEIVSPEESFLEEKTIIEKAAAPLPPQETPTLEAGIPVEEEVANVTRTDLPIPTSLDYGKKLNSSGLTQEVENEIKEVDRFAQVYKSRSGQSKEAIKALADMAAQRATVMAEAKAKLLGGVKGPSVAEKGLLAATGGLSGVLFGTYKGIEDAKRRKQFLSAEFDKVTAAHDRALAAVDSARLQSLLSGKKIPTTHSTAVSNALGLVGPFLQAGGLTQDINKKTKNQIGLGDDQRIFDYVEGQIEGINKGGDEADEAYQSLLALNGVLSSTTKSLNDSEAGLREEIEPVVNNVLSKDKTYEDLMVTLGNPVDRKGQYKRIFNALNAKYQNDNASDQYSLEKDAAQLSGKEKRPYTPPPTLSKNQQDHLRSIYNNYYESAAKATKGERESLDQTRNDMTLVVDGTPLPPLPPDATDAQIASRKITIDKVYNGKLSVKEKADSDTGIALQSIAKIRGAMAAAEGKQIIQNPFDKNKQGLSRSKWEEGFLDEKKDSLLERVDEEDKAILANKHFSNPIKALYEKVYGTDITPEALERHTTSLSDAASYADELSDVRALQQRYKVLVGGLAKEELVERGLREFPQMHELSKDENFDFSNERTLEIMLAQAADIIDEKQAATLKAEDDEDSIYFDFWTHKPEDGPPFRTWFYTEKAGSLTDAHLEKIAGKALRLLNLESQLLPAGRNIRTTEHEKIMREKWEEIERRKKSGKPISMPDNNLYENKALEAKQKGWGGGWYLTIDGNQYEFEVDGKTYQGEFPKGKDVFLHKVSGGYVVIPKNRTDRIQFAPKAETEEEEK